VPAPGLQQQQQQQQQGKAGLMGAAGSAEVEMPWQVSVYGGDGPMSAIYPVQQVWQDSSVSLSFAEGLLAYCLRVCQLLTAVVSPVLQNLLACLSAAPACYVSRSCRRAPTIASHAV
jgi:hypothetical protein